ncbi:protein rep [Marinobacter salsuginis]|uniref:protein rep n=1 Tax=Marinobacter salsuginis TaxID=418719 RepID=UPI00273ED1CD|nr:protein rep [Marinobacter salsuginis]
MSRIVDPSITSYQTFPARAFRGLEARPTAVSVASGATDTVSFGGRLGNITESAATSTVCRINTESLQAPLDEVIARMRGRRLRYSMLKTVGNILPGHRVTACQKVPSYGVQAGTASRGISADANGHTHFHGVGSCGDVWNCPVCAARIAAGRRSEVQKAMSAHRKTRGVCLLVTFTFPHANSDSLSENLTCFLDALRRMKSWRGFKSARESIGYSAQIRALEVTHSNANGWHPHAHEIWFLDSTIDKEQVSVLEDALYTQWVRACHKVGLGTPSREHGVDVQFRDTDSDDDACGAYVAKWGSELTFSHMKSGKKGSRTPWSILADLDAEYSFRDAELFREYSKAFKGRAQLFWSRGLKDRYDVEEVSDEVMADAPEKEIVREITPREWAAILKTDSRVQVLEVAEFQRERLDDFIQSLVQRVETQQREKERLSRDIYRSTLEHMAGLRISPFDTLSNFP